jgi:hypothetical protein
MRKGKDAWLAICLYMGLVLSPLLIFAPKALLLTVLALAWICACAAFTDWVMKKRSE